MLSAQRLLHEVKRRTATARSVDPLDAYCPHAGSITERQGAFLGLDCLEAFYGGAAGGGKTDALLMAALQYVHVPAYSAILFRRTYTDLALPGAIMDRAHEWLQETDAHWSERDKRYTFPSGATLQFAYLAGPRDHLRYKSAAFQFIGFDELTQFTATQYLYLFSRLRRLKSQDVPLRQRGASNPGDIGHFWVKGRFIDPESRDDRVFVPAKLDDNPHLDADAYRKALARLDPTTRAQLELGQWITDAGGQMFLFDRTRDLAPALPDLKDPVYILGVDLGASERKPTTALAVLAYSPASPIVWVAESEALVSTTPTATAEAIHRVGNRYDLTRIVVDAGALGKGYVEELKLRWGIPAEAADKRDRLGAVKLVNGAFANGDVRIVASTNVALIETLQTLQWNEQGTDSAAGSEDHLADAFRYAFKVCQAYAFEAPVAKAKVGSDQWMRDQAAQMEEQMMRTLERQARLAEGLADYSIDFEDYE
jgi:hypothetical protein